MAPLVEKDAEANNIAGKSPASVPHWRLVYDQALVTPEVLKW